MQTLSLFMTLSLDGFIGGDDEGAVEDAAASTDPQGDHQWANELFAAADTVLFGRTTYEGFIQYWDTLDLTDTSLPTVEVEFARTFRRLKRVVFSRTLTGVAAHTRLISDDLQAQVVALKQQPGPGLLLVCGPELLATLIELDVVDELRLILMPRARGKGQALFGQLRRPIRLQLLSTREFKSGGVLHHYQVNKA